jgi:hypothetical protein
MYKWARKNRTMTLMPGFSHSLILCRLSAGFENPPSKKKKKKKPNYSENIKESIMCALFLRVRA